MKFGVDAPWYDDPVERLAFNLYAMDKQREMDLANAVQDYLNGDEDLDYLRDKYNLTDKEYELLLDELNDRNVL